MITLNRRAAFSNLYGNCVAKFYQGGKYFDSSGNELPAEIAGKPASLSQRQIHEINKERERQDIEPITKDEVPNLEKVPAEGGETKATEDAKGTEAGQPAEDAAPAESEAVEDDKPSEEFEARVAEAMKLHNRSLLALCQDIYEKMEDTSEVPEPYTGEGSKEKNAHWLAYYGPAD